MRTTKSKTTSSNKRAKTSTLAATERARRLIEEEEPLTDVTDSQSDIHICALGKLKSKCTE